MSSVHVEKKVKLTPCILQCVLKRSKNVNVLLI